MMTNYKLYILTPNKRKYWEGYSNLESAIWAMLERLNVLDSLALAEEGEFVTSEMFGVPYEKKYKIEVKCPHTILILRKMSSGSWNVDTVRHLIKTIKNIYVKEG